jgi:hypothetical protein
MSSCDLVPTHYLRGLASYYTSRDFDEKQGCYNVTRDSLLTNRRRGVWGGCRQMPRVGRKAQEAWAEFKESWEMILDIEREGLKLTEVEADKNYDLIRERLRQAEGLVKKRNDALKRYLHHMKRGE